MYLLDINTYTYICAKNRYQIVLYDNICKHILPLIQHICLLWQYLTLMALEPQNTDVVLIW